jgi:4a-hydroxytetrahydrobiopterin dehydratase
MTALIKQFCGVCEENAKEASKGDLEVFAKQAPSWKVLEVKSVKQLQREFGFGNFVDALSFTQKVGELAEVENHHPSIVTEWGKVTVTWWTHAINGLHQNDLIAAAKTDLLYK